jgi:hypothetical protein
MNLCKLETPETRSNTLRELELEVEPRLARAPFG